MSEYICTNKFDTNDGPNKYLWPMYLNIWISKYSCHTLTHTFIGETKAINFFLRHCSSSCIDPEKESMLSEWEEEIRGNYSADTSLPAFVCVYVCVCRKDQRSFTNSICPQPHYIVFCGQILEIVFKSSYFHRGTLIDSNLNCIFGQFWKLQRWVKTFGWKVFMCSTSPPVCALEGPGSLVVVDCVRTTPALVWFMRVLLRIRTTSHGTI